VVAAKANPPAEAPPAAEQEAAPDVPQYPRRMLTEPVDGKMTVVLEFNSEEEARAAGSSEEPWRVVNGWRVRLPEEVS